MPALPPERGWGSSVCPLPLLPASPGSSATSFRYKANLLLLQHSSSRLDAQQAAAGMQGWKKNRRKRIGKKNKQTKPNLIILSYLSGGEGGGIFFFSKPKEFPSKKRFCGEEVLLLAEHSAPGRAQLSPL